MFFVFETRVFPTSVAKYDNAEIRPVDAVAVARDKFEWQLKKLIAAKLCMYKSRVIISVI